MGLFAQVFDEPARPRSAATSRWALPYSTPAASTGQPPAELPLHRHDQPGAPAQRQPDQHPELGRAARRPGTGQHRHRGDVDNRRAHRAVRQRPRRGVETARSHRRSAGPRGPTAVFMDEQTLYGCVRGTRRLSGLLVLAGLTPLGGGPARRPRWTIVGARFVGARSSPGELVCIRRARVLSRSSLTCGRSRADAVRVRLPGAAGHHDLRPGGARHPGRGRRQLPFEHPADADLFIPVPESVPGPAAIGLPEASGIPFGQGLFKTPTWADLYPEPSQNHQERGIS